MAASTAYLLWALLNHHTRSASMSSLPSPQFLATTRALLLRLTAANLKAGDNGLASTCVHVQRKLQFQSKQL